MRGHDYILQRDKIEDLYSVVEDFMVYSRMNNMTVSTSLASEVFGWSSHHSGQTLSIDQQLFSALYSIIKHF